MAKLLRNEMDWQIVFTGTESERPLIERIREASRVPTISVAGRLSLEELAAMIELVQRQQDDLGLGVGDTQCVEGREREEKVAMPLAAKDRYLADALFNRESG